MVGVAQLVRALGCGPRGRGFESPRSPQIVGRYHFRYRRHEILIGEHLALSPSVVPRNAPLAQLVEQRTLNPQVLGSIPRGRTISTELVNLLSALFVCACVTYLTMVEKEGIERLLFAYSDGLDRGDLVATSELFGTDGLYGQVDGPAVRGASQVLAAMKHSVHLYDGVPRTRHIVTNIVIDVNDDQITAQCRSYVQVLHQPPGGALGPVAAGTYFDHVQLTNGTWKFAERRMLIDLIGDMSTHLLHNPFV